MVLTETAETGSPPRSPGAGRGRMRRWAVVLAVAVVVVGGALVSWRVLGGGAPGPLPASAGITEDHSVPVSVRTAPLVDEQGRPTTLATFAGRIVVLVPFLTSCQEVCPLTTAALLRVQQSLAEAGVGRQVAIVEVTLDPERDTPSRLAAYGRLTGAHWSLVTGSPSTIDAFWHSLGVYAQRVPEGTPAGIDWQTGRPYTYDIDHSDGFFLLDPHQRERFLTLSAPDVRSTPLPPALRSMLDDQGRQNLLHPEATSWTVGQMLQGIGWLAGRSIPQAA